MITATQRSIRKCRADDWLVAVVQQWIPAPYLPGGGFRRDLFGWMDILGYDGDRWVAIQACSMSGRAAHLEKMLGSDALNRNIALWCECETHSAELWSWAKRKRKRGGKQFVWQLDIVDLGTFVV
jgi:nicotinamidase-related amidase